MSKLLIVTQVYENYAWREDGSIGTGADAYWKAKGGCDYVVKNVDVNSGKEVVEAVRSRVEEDNEYYREYIIDWEIVEDDYLTQFERDQLEYDGRIEYPARELEIA